MESRLSPAVAMVTPATARPGLAAADRALYASPRHVLAPFSARRSDKVARAPRRRRDRRPSTGSPPVQPVQEDPGEAHLSAEQPTPGQAPRLSSPHVGPCRSCGDPVPSAQGPSQAVGLGIGTPVPVGRIRDRATFEALRHSRLRTSSGRVRLVHVPAAARTDGAGAGPAVRVGFAVGRRVGGAVERNRVRRRTRAVLAEVNGTMMPGAYLVSFAPGAAEMSFEELRTDVERALSRMVQRIVADPESAPHPGPNRVSHSGSAPRKVPGDV
jgi:ribonuclease P protein component